MRNILSILILTLSLSACGSTQSKNSGIASDVKLSEMNKSQAAKIIEEFRAKYGYANTAQASAASPTSITEVLAIVKANRISEYDAARNFMLGKSGPEAMTLRALIELSLSSTMLTVASILEESQARKSAELKQLKQPRQTGTPVQDAKTRIAKLSVEINDLSKTARALHVLTDEPLSAAAGLAKEAIRQSPNNRAGYLAQADYYRMRHQWIEYDRALRNTDDNTDASPLKTYIVAMEALERYADPKKCREMLDHVLASDPKFVAAQASLVQVQDDIETKYAELQKLRALNPNHPIITTAGKMIEDEYNDTVELRQALKSQ